MTTGPKNTNVTTGDRPCLVIVDDERSILSSLRSLLRRQQYDIFLFDNGYDAVEFVTHRTPDVIISDMRMPEMNGIEFLDQAMLLCPTSTRLMLSGYEDKVIIFDAIAHSVAHQFITKPWDDEKMLRIIAGVIATRQELRIRHLDAILQSISSLPSPPEAQQQIQRILRKETRTIRELAAEVEKVPALMARLMRISNSIYYSGRQPISTALEAVSFIGAEYVESLIFAMSIHHHTEDKLIKECGIELDDLWRHAVHRAVLGRSIAEEWPGFNDSTLAYTVCLLIDIGFLVRFNTNPDQSRQLITLSKTLQISLHEAESRVFTVSHAAIGAALLRLWNFPATIIAAIEQHHDDTRGDALSQIVQIADIVESGDQQRAHDRRVDPMVKEWTKKKSHIY